MPYVPLENRLRLFDAGGVDHKATKGDLCFLITKVMVEFLDTHIPPGEKVSWTMLSEIASACDEAAAEWRRRLIGPYENTAIARNGDVYPKWLIAMCEGQKPDEGEKDV